MYGYDLVMNKCLRYYGSDNQIHSEIYECRLFGGTLVTINNAIENRAVVQYASDQGQDRIWLGSYCFGNSSSSCYNDDYSDSSYRSKYKSDGKWFENFNNSAYYVVEGSIDEAEIECQKNNGHVVSIHSKQENDFILNRMALVPENVRLGAKRVFNNSYAWADGTLWDFDFRDQLDDMPESLDCLEIFTVHQLWSRTDCDTTASNICKIPLPPIEDNSHCNTTLLMSPSTFTSYGYGMQGLQSPCTWKIVAPGPYQVNLQFLEMRNSSVTVLDASGKLIASVNSTVKVLAESNIVTVVHNGQGTFKASALAF
ncbi:hypothetical protein GCK72_020525 [Caenorhabditis remanei]|uniref:C-type lectin domain-containing protein n=1 Tax=Caenorhabditis remanei TaxID=31234 RepID=A0A6A5GFJ0_CAERE|nr:hypothetical protein GCK72_020525 [Caenorhabditis remanei]KAF1753968.1 hypothetical protein GCK72_020525 [Caenorhabditis remanei]